MLKHRRWVCPLLVLGLTVGLEIDSARKALARYREFRSAWSWDLAYYNQWYWALTKGDGRITVRPFAPYAEEGPSVWKMNYLAPIRLALVPFYALRPGPETLLVAHAIVFWWLVPAAYGLARSETGSPAFGLSAGLLAAATPLLGPLAANDFRELQLATPFVLWSVQGYRARDRRLSALGVLGMLACRQEFAVVAGSLALLRAREPEDAGRSLAWARAVVWTAVAWFCLAFLGYLGRVVGPYAPERYLGQFAGERPPIPVLSKTAAEIAVLGLGAWAFAALFAPRALLLSLPWLWSLAGGRWNMGMLETVDWHHVRYAAPFTATALAAGVLGLAELYRRVRDRPYGRLVFACLWLVAFAGTLAARVRLDAKLARVPVEIQPDEAVELWRTIDRVPPSAGVVSAYQTAAPLSSRKLLFSYRLDQNRPKGYPGTIGPEIGPIFLENGALNPKVLIGQGFKVVFSGRFLTVFEREAKKIARLPKKKEKGANVSRAGAVERRVP